MGVAENTGFLTFPLAINPTTNIKDEGLWNLSLPNIILFVSVVAIDYFFMGSISVNFYLLHLENKT